MSCLPETTGDGSRGLDCDTVAVDRGDRQTILVQDFEISLDRLLGVPACFLDRFALGGDARQLRHEHAVAAVWLGHDHHVKLAFCAHQQQDSALPMALLLSTGQTASLVPCRDPRFECPPIQLHRLKRQKGLGTKPATTLKTLDLQGF